MGILPDFASKIKRLYKKLVFFFILFTMFKIEEKQMEKVVLHLIEFMKTVERLCLVKRDNLLSCGGHETDSDHTFKLMFLVMAITPYLSKKVDPLKLMYLALIHDLVEAETNDIPLSAQAQNPQLREEKKKAEEIAILSFRKRLPTPLGDQIYELFHEFEERSTREAKIVYALDKLEANLQANQYHEGDVRYWGDCVNGSFYYQNALQKKEFVSLLGEDILIELERAIIELSRKNMKKIHLISNE